MTKTYTQLCAELAPLQAKADHLEGDLAAFDAWIFSEEGQRFLDLREARNDAFYALPIAEQERIEALRDERDALLDTIESAHLDWFEAQAAFDPDDADSQAALARAQAHYDAANQALEDFDLKA